MLSRASRFSASMKTSRVAEQQQRIAIRLALEGAAAGSAPAGTRARRASPTAAPAAGPPGRPGGGAKRPVLRRPLEDPREQEEAEERAQRRRARCPSRCDGVASGPSRGPGSRASRLAVALEQRVVEHDPSRPEEAREVGVRVAALARGVHHRDVLHGQPRLSARAPRCAAAARRARAPQRHEVLKSGAISTGASSARNAATSGAAEFGQSPPEPRASSG